MNENDGGFTVPSVGELSSVEESAADKSLIGNFGSEKERQVEGGFVEGNEGDVMVDVVGLDVSVDGFGGEGGLERKVGKESFIREGGTSDGGDVGGGDLKLEEVVDHSSQVWDSLVEDGVGNVEHGEGVVIEESLDLGEKLGKDEGSLGNALGDEIGIDADVGILGPTRREAENLLEEVTVTESVGVADRGSAGDGEGGTTDFGDGEALLQEYVTSGQDVIEKPWRPAVSDGDLCSSKIEESLTTHSQLVLEEVRDTVVGNDNLDFQEVNQSSTIELICEESDKGVMNTNDEYVDGQAKVDEEEISEMSKQEGLHLKDGVKETDPVAGNSSSPDEKQVLNVKTSCENSESGEDVRVNDNNSCKSIGEGPNNVSLGLVDGVLGEVDTACADEKSFDEDSKFDADPSVAIDSKSSISVPLPHHADADEPLVTKTKEFGCSVSNIDRIEDQVLKDNVGDCSKVDVALCSVQIHSDVQTQYVTTSEVTATETKVLNSVVEVLTTRDIGSFVASPKEGENVNCEKEPIKNGDKYGNVPVDSEYTLEEAFVDGGDDTGMMDIDEVMNWKDEVPENNTFSGTLSDLEEEHLKLNIDKVGGGTEIETTQENLKSSELIHTTDESGVALMELENTMFDVQEEVNGIDVDFEPMELDSSKGDVSLSEIGENASVSGQLDETGNISTGQAGLGISMENVLDRKGDILVMDENTNFNYENVMQEEKQEIVLQQAETHIYDVRHGHSTDLPNMNEMTNKEASVVVKPDRVAENDGESQPALTSTAVHNEGNTARSCFNDSAAPLPDRIGSLENTVKLHVSDSNDEIVDSSIPGQELEAQEGYSDGEQEPETQPLTTETENLLSVDEEEPELGKPVAENERAFSVSDLVWGKVRSHPWWPGQIFDPTDASEKALKYHKNDSFLVAYFGDRTFAWNDASVLKPFKTHFSQVEKHNNSETFRHAVNCALEEVSRRVELGLTCSCIPQDAYEKIKYQVVENAGIKEESSKRYGVEKSSAINSFEPKKLLDYVRALARAPYDGTDQLELVMAKAQLSSFSRYRGYPQLPEFQYSGELLENNESLTSTEAIEHPASIYKEDKEVVVGNNSQKRKSIMMDTPSAIDGEDVIDGKCTSKSVSSVGKKRRAIESFPDGADKGTSSQAAKSSAVSLAPKPSFKIGECIRRAASQLTGSPSLLKSSSEKFLKVDEEDEKPSGLEVSVQTSPRGRMNNATDQSSVDEMLSQLKLAAQDPMKGYSFLSTFIPFFSSYRSSVISKAKRVNSSAGRQGTARKRKATNDASNTTPEEFEFDDVSDSYWTDRIIQNHAEEQLPQDGPNGGVQYQPVVLEPKKKGKSGNRTNSRKRFSISKLETETEKPAEEDVDRRKQDLPTELVLNFAVGVSIPPEMNLNRTLKRFGPLMESETEVDRESSRARVVFKKCSDAEVAYNSAGKFNIFGSKLVNYELNYSPLVSYKPLPLPTLLSPEDAI